ncbi:MAG: Holliday junction branch migration DNA helicase RuvB [Actinomycetota bacterium]|nr:Holliday junction branch migration DNA helicase RuvB [Actinomycetota bacterium]MDK1037566.1 Holliday junction branch migration DNA helicase RuvB [Actinomycetota bacterium]MDK1097390.1 Holliday junction branch migration DNA helicase RuvB [Actinomycetota bacterium]MDK1292246.1 Holliday junction branch migration DNA helicase RuvB [Actinomycetota bacterium]
MREEGLLTSVRTEEEIAAEVGLRPRVLDEFIGQEALKERLSILIEAASARNESVDHLLFSGPPGLGKTSLAAIVANEMGATFRSTSGPALERPGDLAAVITNLEQGDVLFIDEVHRLPRQVEEVLYPAMEDGQLDIVVGKGPAARSIKIDLPPFTLVGATTRVGRVAPPLRDRFGYVARIDYYGAEDLAAIVVRSAALLGTPITPDGCESIARRSRGTPRIANRLLRRVRDYASVRADGSVDAETADAALEVFEVDEAGLDKVDRAILVAIIEKFGGGPVGLSTLAIAVGEDTETVEDAYEPFLILEGMLQRTPRGRIATQRAYLHLGIEPPPPGAQGQLMQRP